MPWPARANNSRQRWSGQIGQNRTSCEILSAQIVTSCSKHLLFTAKPDTIYSVFLEPEIRAATPVKGKAVPIGQKEHRGGTGIFINPVAGKRDASAELVPRIQAAARQLQLPQPQIVVTQHAGQAREAAHRYAASGTPVALYACGGDGTLNELVQGAAGSANVAVGCVPCGSGNDYVRNFGAAGQAPFF